ncbi:hypothetical protein EDC96DRAFT_351135 [Choanephora cucurbitarum]|nr:hypothetical protein EDC96DRAFT_351135 [Choanephora cucurbitarum]
MDGSLHQERWRKLSVGSQASLIARYGMSPQQRQEKASEDLRKMKSRPGQSMEALVDRFRHLVEISQATFFYHMKKWFLDPLPEALVKDILTKVWRMDRLEETDLEIYINVALRVAKLYADERLRDAGSNSRSKAPQKKHSPALFSPFSSSSRPRSHEAASSSKKPERYCRYHESYTHGTEECRQQKRMRRMAKEAKPSKDSKDKEKERLCFDCKKPWDQSHNCTVKAKRHAKSKYKSVVPSKGLPIPQESEDKHENHNQEFLPPPLASNCVESRAFEKLYKNIFDQSHLQIIHSAYFGLIGTKQDTSSKNPIVKAFVDAMPPREDKKCTVDTYLMKKAYSMYFVNFKNMWTRPCRFRKTLNLLLSHLLRIHLAPERTKQYNYYLSQSKQDHQKIKRPKIMSTCQPFLFPQLV